MNSSARILSQKRVLVKNLERFPCRLANRIIVLNVYQISLPLTVITSSVSFEHVGSLPSGCNMLLDSSSLFYLFIFFGGKETVFLPWLMFELAQLLFLAPKPCSRKGENRLSLLPLPFYIVFALWLWGMLFYTTPRNLNILFQQCFQAQVFNTKWEVIVNRVFKNKIHSRFRNRITIDLICIKKKKLYCTIEP